jgi:hypothetical protein
MMGDNALGMILKGVLRVGVLTSEMRTEKEYLTSKNISKSNRKNRRRMRRRSKKARRRTVEKKGFFLFV